MKRGSSANSRPALLSRSAAAPKTAGNVPRGGRASRNVWLHHHLYALFSTLGQLVRTPLATLMTVVVIGIALALPTGLFLLVENMQRISVNWGNTTQISLFLKPSIEDAQAVSLAEQLELSADILSVQVITRAEALNEYKQLSGFADALSLLEENPLPAVLVVQPRLDVGNVAESQALLGRLKGMAEVDVAQFDTVWLERLLAMLAIAQRGVLIIGSLLGATVLLVVGNTIRLAIHNRREEIEINKLFGATDSFIRRPFLYSGFWYGVGGALVAWLLIYLSFWFLQEPVRQLSALYVNQFALRMLDFRSTLVLFSVSIALGLLGSWLAVGRHLREIQPR